MKQIAVLAAFCCAAALPLAADPVIETLINALRQEERLQPLRYSDRLEIAARRHAQDMAKAGIFSHDGSDGSDVAARVAQTGYGWCVVAENIARGHETREEVIAAWAASAGHRANMLSPDVTEVALARGDGLIWVMVLARSGC